MLRPRGGPSWDLLGGLRRSSAQISGWQKSGRTHIPHLQKSTSAITCSCLQRVIAVFGHLRVIGAYFEKCSIDKSAVSTDYCVSQTGAPSESNRAFVVIEHSLLQVNHPQRSRREENTQEPGKGCGMWAEARVGVEINPK